MNVLLKIALCIIAILEFPGLITTAPPDNLLAGRTYCGYQHTDDYYHTNHHIAIDEYPWMAQILYNEKKLVGCSGSLINARYVLTAAHCLINPYRAINVTGVRLGDYNVTTDNDCARISGFGVECSDPVEEFEIEEKIPHPSFNAESLKNDIGLIRLSKYVQYSDYIRPICLPQQDYMEVCVGQRLATSGWGVNLGGVLTDIKKRVFATVITEAECSTFYNKLPLPISNNQICTRGNESFTCEGDGGAPLMRSIKNQWEQVGVVSFGRDCGSSIPRVYTKVSTYMKWIQQNIRP